MISVRDEEWLVTAAEATSQGTLIHARGLSDLVRGTTASFYSGLDTVTVVNPAHARIVADTSPGFRLYPFLHKQRSSFL